MANTGPSSIFSTTCIYVTCIYVIRTVTNATRTIGDALGWLWRTATNWVTERIASVAARVPPSTDWSDPYRPSVLLVRARAFIERIAHRELRQITPGWRACPSI